MVRRLNFGCGNDYREGWDNADLYAKKADFRFDFDKFPYPLGGELYDYIFTSQVLEHLWHPDKAMQEFYRILKPGGTVEIIVPHYTTAGDHNFRHKSHFSTGAIKDFLTGNESQNEAVVGGETFELVSAIRKMRGIHINVPGYIFDW